MNDIFVYILTLKFVKFLSRYVLRRNKIVQKITNNSFDSLLHAA